ncbi:uncharacterized protein LOC135395863 [Ornithodoros turicata]|uniref:uncharacterized protein LOC135395863 n=1 Tax=Ornithodoros turicata TaxID=34597 RepID=UPI0031386EC3
MRDTKRSLLQAIARIFDPFGFLASFTIKAKIIFQLAWEQGVRCDDPLPDEIAVEWSRWINAVLGILKISVPRALMPEESTSVLFVHCFCDASIRAYGTVVHLRTESNIAVEMVAAKSRIAPLKRVTLPRLELLGALLGARLTTYVVRALHLEEEVTCFWSNSSIVLHWIKGSASRWKPFVENRVTEIQTLCDPSRWHFCPGHENPADLTTRGVQPERLIIDEFSWRGPKWLSSSDETWSVLEQRAPEPSTDAVEGEMKGVLQCLAAAEAVAPQMFHIRDFNILVTVLRLTAWIKRFAVNCRSTEAK